MLSGYEKIIDRAIPGEARERVRGRVVVEDEPLRGAAEREEPEGHDRAHQGGGAAKASEAHCIEARQLG
jgi:hypothetical protein